jgi:hypothetical protein
VNIFLTFDYELFFGARTGTVDKCMIEPTQKLLKIAGDQVKMTFFVDVGFLVRSKVFSANNPELKDAVQRVEGQIQEIVQRGHDVQLHIHPHWDRSEYANGNWIINAEGAYRLDDFSDSEIDRIVREYKNYLDELVGYKTDVFRAGGWCIQPFSRLKSLFLELGIRYDSSVIPGFSYNSPHYKIDFSDIKERSHYRFETEVNLPDSNGSFVEYPISSFLYTPLFYWSLYILGRLSPKRHKMVGDGTFIPQPGRKIKGLTKFNIHHVSCDGYYASVLNKTLIKLDRENTEEMLIIGHPKSMTEYSFEKLSEFIQSASEKHTFVTFKEVKRI